MTSQNLVPGTSKIPLVRHTRKSYMMGQMQQDQVLKMRTIATTWPLQLIHSDLCGPMFIALRIKSNYLFFSFYDFIRKTWLY
jgi:hypothetical protein